jgi:DNA ligase-1
VKDFVDLCAALEQTDRTVEQTAALARYFASAPPADAAWAVALLLGRTPRAAASLRMLIAWAREAAGLPDWLFEECRQVTDDRAETIARILPEPDRPSALPLSQWIEERLLPLADVSEAACKESVQRAWTELDSAQRLVWNRLLSGGFRVRVAPRIVRRALSRVAGIDGSVIAHRLAGDWSPSAAFWAALCSADTRDVSVSQRYPFFLAQALPGELEALGDPAAWQVEWKWEGLRVQLVRRAGQTFLWSLDEDLITERFPELIATAAQLPEGTVIDGVISPAREVRRRLGRTPSARKQLLVPPVELTAFDLLEEGGIDLRTLPLTERRSLLERLLGVGAPAGSSLRLSPLVASGAWQELARLRKEGGPTGTAGLILKRRESSYGMGRQRGDWWTWGDNALTVDAVLMYAQRGRGKYATLYTDCTFGVWDGEHLVPVARGCTGLTEEALRRVDALVRQNTSERFGPVRAVKPRLVFELAFDGLDASARHKAGLVLRAPRLLRWRTDKVPAQASTLASLRGLLARETA